MKRILTKLEELGEGFEFKLAQNAALHNWQACIIDKGNRIATHRNRFLVAMQPTAKEAVSRLAKLCGESKPVRS